MGENGASLQIAVNMAAKLCLENIDTSPSLVGTIQLKKNEDSAIEPVSAEELKEEMPFLSAPPENTTSETVMGVMEDGACSSNISVLRPTQQRGKILKNMIKSLAPDSAVDENISKENERAPVKSNSNTNTPDVLPRRRGKTLRFQNQAESVSPGTRAHSSPTYSAPSIAVTPHELEAVDALTHLSASPKAYNIASNSTSKTPKKVGGGLDQTYFPVAVHDLVSDTAKKHPDVIDWVEDGEAFVIKVTTGKKLERILKKHFRHGKFTSLQRQLNMYGWSKWQVGKYKGAFHNPQFHRDIGSPEELGSILRNGPPCSSKRPAVTKQTRRNLVSRKHSGRSNYSSSQEDQLDVSEETSKEMPQIVTLSGRTRVTPVRYTDEPTIKMHLKPKAALSNEALVADLTALTGSKELRMKAMEDAKGHAKMTSSRRMKTVAINLTKKNATIKEAFLTKKRRLLKQEGGYKKPLQSIRRYPISVTKPASQMHIEYVPTPTATTPTKFFGDLMYTNESVDAGSKLWGYDPVSSVTVPSWSPFVDEAIEANPARPLYALPRPGGTPGSVRMTLFHETPRFASPVISSPGSRHHQVPCVSLYRSTSSCSTSGFTPMPLPLLRKQSSSVYVQEFMGYIPALQAALGVKLPSRDDSNTAGANSVTASTDLYKQTPLSLAPKHPGSACSSPPLTTKEIDVLESPHIGGCT